MVRSYAGGLIFTTSLPPPVLAAARTSIAILKSSEGRQLREEHRRRVAIVRRRLQEAGLPAPDVPSHIVPVFVSSSLYIYFSIIFLVFAVCVDTVCFLWQLNKIGVGLSVRIPRGQ